MSPAQAATGPGCHQPGASSPSLWEHTELLIPDSALGPLIAVCPRAVEGAGGFKDLWGLPKGWAPSPPRRPPRDGGFWGAHCPRPTEQRQPWPRGFGPHTCGGGTRAWSRGWAAVGPRRATPLCLPHGPGAESAPGTAPDTPDIRIASTPSAAPQSAGPGPSVSFVPDPPVPVTAPLPQPLRVHPGSSRRIPAPLTRLPPGPAGRGPGSPRPGVPAARDAPAVPPVPRPPRCGRSGRAGPRPRARRRWGAGGGPVRRPRSPAGPPRRGRPGTEPFPGAAPAPPAGAALGVSSPAPPTPPPTGAAAPACGISLAGDGAANTRRCQPVPVPPQPARPRVPPTRGTGTGTGFPHRRHPPCPGPGRERRGGTTDSAGPAPRTAPRSRVGARPAAPRALPEALWVRDPRPRRTRPPGGPRGVPPPVGATEPGAGPGSAGQREGGKEGQTDRRKDGRRPPSVSRAHGSPREPRVLSPPGEPITPPCPHRGSPSWIGMGVSPADARSASPAVAAVPAGSPRAHPCPAWGGPAREGLSGGAGAGGGAAAPG
ncbi:basic proline-rich protein-like [Oenanthe melanoleuca]|uniref:basic proline-rich protein-like n=1 Tax=Oenanthe melanoleuca TaxID=2939378 RepID=UPI0024C1D038|nr:basic proline-rich protein-like [Oenanthe melanoleuca]